MKPGGPWERGVRKESVSQEESSSRLTDMHPPHFSELMNGKPLGRDRAKVISPYDWHGKGSKCAVAERLHTIVVSLLESFSWVLKPLFRHSVKETVSLVQDRDPYLEGLLTALHGRK